MSIDAQFQLQLGAFVLDAQLRVGRGVTTLFGPSGVGKSTVLRCLAGLERAQGRLQVGEQCWQDDARGIFVPTSQRPLGYVFQESRLFAHLTVEKNLRFGMQRVPQAQRFVDWDEIIALLDIGHLLSRRPEKLSGGEQQRVAIGRALLTSPQLLLMDEPLASLDQARKQEVLPFVRRLREQLQIPLVYVSHSLSEVLQITDTLVLMRDGKTVAAGAISELSTQFAAGRTLGELAGAVIETTVLAHDDSFGLTQLDFAGQHLQLPRLQAQVGSRQRVHILARNVGIAVGEPPANTSFLNVLPATVTAVQLPDDVRQPVLLTLDAGAPLLASISHKSLHTLGLQPGINCFAMIKAVSLAETETPP
ncbi:MAG: molybdenum ABC transporter ATP-binding protein [Gammaproteobacteria bacterium]|nr:molybdenum ABC transporter ATP-binding protein [Gammaproteobacteria bacterium]